MPGLIIAALYRLTGEERRDRERYQERRESWAAQDAAKRYEEMRDLKRREVEAVEKMAASIQSSTEHS